MPLRGGGAPAHRGAEADLPARSGRAGQPPPDRAGGGMSAPAPGRALMEEGAFLRAFEDCTLPAELFDHREHVRLAWLYLRGAPLLVALDRFCRGLRRFAAAAGMPDRYHETITWAYLFLIHE